MKKIYEKLMREMSFWQLIFGKCLSVFVYFSKNYIWKMSIQGNAFMVMTVNQGKV